MNASDLVKDVADPRGYFKSMMTQDIPESFQPWFEHVDDSDYVPLPTSRFAIDKATGAFDAWVEKDGITYIVVGYCHPATRKLPLQIEEIQEVLIAQYEVDIYQVLECSEIIEFEALALEVMS